MDLLNTKQKAYPFECGGRYGDSSDEVVPVPSYSSTTPWRSMGERKYIASILDLGNRWSSVVRFTHRLLYLREKNPE
jgi:hypothetical protein